jgi:hypothetical protein
MLVDPGSRLAGSKFSYPVGNIRCHSVLADCMSGHDCGARLNSAADVSSISREISLAYIPQDIANDLVSLFKTLCNCDKSSIDRS